MFQQDNYTGENQNFCFCELKVASEFAFLHKRNVRLSFKQDVSLLRVRRLEFSFKVADIEMFDRILCFVTAFNYFQ